MLGLNDPQDQLKQRYTSDLDSGLAIRLNEVVLPARYHLKFL